MFDKSSHFKQHKHKPSYYFLQQLLFLNELKINIRNVLLQSCVHVTACKAMGNMARAIKLSHDHVLKSLSYITIPQNKGK